MIWVFLITVKCDLRFRHLNFYNIFVKYVTDIRFYFFLPFALNIMTMENGTHIWNPISNFMNFFSENYNNLK